MGDFASYLRLSALRKEEEDGKDTFSFTIVDGKLDGKDAGKGNDAFEAILTWLKDCPPLPQCEAFRPTLNLITHRYEYRQCRIGGSNYAGRILCKGHAWQQIKQERE